MGASRGGSHALLLNPDAALRPGAIRRLLDDAAKHPAAAVVAPRLEYPDGAPQVNFGEFPGLRALSRRIPVRLPGPFCGTGTLILLWLLFCQPKGPQLVLK